MSIRSRQMRRRIRLNASLGANILDGNISVHRYGYMGVSLPDEVQEIDVGWISASKSSP